MCGSARPASPNHRPSQTVLAPPSVSRYDSRPRHNWTSAVYIVCQGQITAGRQSPAPVLICAVGTARTLALTATVTLRALPSFALSILFGDVKCKITRGRFLAMSMPCAAFVTLTRTPSHRALSFVRQPSCRTITLTRCLRAAYAHPQPSGGVLYLRKKGCGSHRTLIGDWCRARSKASCSRIDVFATRCAHVHAKARAATVLRHPMQRISGTTLVRLRSYRSAAALSSISR